MPEKIRYISNTLAALGTNLS